MEWATSWRSGEIVGLGVELLVGEAVKVRVGVAVAVEVSVTVGDGLTVLVGVDVAPARNGCEGQCDGTHAIAGKRCERYDRQDHSPARACILCLEHLRHDITVLVKAS